MVTQQPFTMTEQQMYDYINCPVLYNLKYVKNIAIESQPTIKELLSKTSVNMFTRMYAGQSPSLDKLKSRWDNICEGIVGTDKRFSREKLAAGMGMLHKAFMWVSDQKFEVLELEAKYTIRLSECEMTGMTGIFVGNKQTGSIELLILDFGETMTDQTFVDLKLKYSLDAYVFYQLHKKVISGIRVHNVKNNRDFLSIRSKDDYKRVETTINNAAKGIKNEIWYPREIGCHFCKAASYCKGWSE